MYEDDDYCYGDYDAGQDSGLMDAILFEESEQHRYLRVPEQEQEREDDPDEPEPGYVTDPWRNRKRSKSRKNIKKLARAVF